MMKVAKYEKEDYERAENMSVSDVIHRLRRIARDWLPDYSYEQDGTEENYTRFVNQMAISRACKLLENLESDS